MIFENSTQRKSRGTPAAFLFNETMACCGKIDGGQTMLRFPFVASVFAAVCLGAAPQAHAFTADALLKIALLASGTGFNCLYAEGTSACLKESRHKINFRRKFSLPDKVYFAPVTSKRRSTF